MDSNQSGAVGGIILGVFQGSLIHILIPCVVISLKHPVSNFFSVFRDDFEPFVEDDISFDDHLSSLSEQGTFGGNDAIVAWARLHQCTVVIHQLNKPLWQVGVK